MLSRIDSISVIGLECREVTVEIDISKGLRAFNIVGLPDEAVKESKERVKSAIKNIKFKFPKGRITVNLAPADIKKIGPSFDLPIAIGILAAAKEINLNTAEKNIIAGELALDGQLRHINGIINIVMYAKNKKYKNIFIPAVNISEASIIQGINIFGVPSLIDLVKHFKKEGKLETSSYTCIKPSAEEEIPIDMALIKGQEHAKRALEIAAAGAHNILMNGAPGAGKTLMAKAFKGILPSLTESEMLDATKVYSIAGLLSKEKPVITTRPFRSVHHTASDVSVVGGGSIPSPGEISLSHRGVLFLDELPEFDRTVLEALRQPLEDSIVTIARARGTLTFPAKFILIAAMNPCPCGYYNVPETKKECVCLPSQLNRYRKKLSGPLLDRIDLFVDIPPVKFDKLTSKECGETTSSIKHRVEEARKIQKERFKNEKITTNSEMDIKQLKKYCQLNSPSLNLLKMAVEEFCLSARGYHKIIKLARTIADLSSAQEIGENHVAEALQYRKQEE